MYYMALKEHSPWKLRSRENGDKAKQNSARNYAKYSKSFQFLCNNSDRTWFFNALTFSRSLGRCGKLRPSASVFNTSHGTWRMLIHEKARLIPMIISVRIATFERTAITAFVVRGLKPVLLARTSVLLLMQLQITSICSIRTGTSTSSVKHRGKHI